MPWPLSNGSSDLSYLATLNQIQPIFRIFNLEFRLLKLNIKARVTNQNSCPQTFYQGQSNNPVFLPSNILSMDIIAFDIDWVWNIFSLHNSCSISLNAHWSWWLSCFFLFEQLINLKKKEKLRTWNLGHIFQIECNGCLVSNDDYFESL